MLLKYFCPECEFYHIEDFKQGEFFIDGSHELDCSFTNKEICVELEKASEEEFEKFIWYIGIKKDIEFKLKHF